MSSEDDDPPPTRIRVLVGPDCARVDGLFGFRSYVIHKNGAVVESHSEQTRSHGVPVQTAHAGIRVVDVLGKFRVLQRVATDAPGSLSHEVIRPKPHGEEVVVSRVPLNRGDLDQGE